MSEKGQGTEGLPVGTGTVLAEPGSDSGAATSAPQKYEGRQPTEAEREAGRWLDEPSDHGSQPEGSGGASATGSGERGSEWIDENTFIGPGGMPFEFQPTEGKPSAAGSGSGQPPTSPAPDPMMGEDVFTPTAPATSGQPSVLEHTRPAESGAPQPKSPTTVQPEPRGPSGPPSEGPTQIYPPDLDLEQDETEGTSKSVLDYMDTKGETPGTDDDQRHVIS